MTDPISRPEAQHALQVLRTFETCMLVTWTAEGEPHARPMVVVELRDDASLTFVTSFASRTVDEIERDGDVLLTFQGKRRFASALGHAIVTRDTARVHTLWKPTFAEWFPDGVDDPYLAIVDVFPEFVEVWDDSGAKAVRYALEVAKAAITNEQPKPIAGTHESVRLR